MNHTQFVEHPGLSTVSTQKMRDGSIYPADDCVAKEAPLEININDHNAKRKLRPFQLIMRTPGDDFDLIRGMFFNDGLIQSSQEIRSIKQLTNPEDKQSSNLDSILVEMKPTKFIDWDKRSQFQYSNSSCGFCGKRDSNASSIAEYPLRASMKFSIDSSLILQLKSRFINSQTLFSQTGGIHAAALFGQNGRIEISKEDVGRHNATDKVIGAWLKRKNHFDKVGLMLSGRVSFELVQKAARAGLPIIIAHGAPTSYAVEAAQNHGISLVGFLKDTSFNIYAGLQRIN